MESESEQPDREQLDPDLIEFIERFLVPALCEEIEAISDKEQEAA